MRILVCGSRHFYDWRLLENILYELNKEEPIKCIIHGGAAGTDSLAGQYAKYQYHEVEVYPADWGKYGKAAGPIRNKQMLDEGKPDLVIAFWDGKSPGTRNMIEQATKANIPVKVINI